MRAVFPVSAFWAALLGAGPAQADELFGGLYAHDVNIVTASGIEAGVDAELGWRGSRVLGPLGPQPQIFVSVNSNGGANFAAAGVSWRIGRSIYIRPGFGLAAHTGATRWSTRRIWFGGPVLFEPEIGIGLQVGPRVSVEASWVHLSHAHVFGHQNPGLDTIGLRFNYHFR